MASLGWARTRKEVQWGWGGRGLRVVVQDLCFLRGGGGLYAMALHKHLHQCYSRLLPK